MATRHAAPPAEHLFGSAAFALAGMLVWAAHLTVVFAAHHLACVSGTDAAVTVGLVVAATLAALGVLVALLVWPRAFARRLGAPSIDVPHGRFLASVMRWLAVLGVAGVAWAGSAPAFVAACGA